MSSGNASSPMPLTMDPSALEAMPRTDGSEASSASLTPGRSAGKYGAKSLGSVNVYIVPMIWVAAFLSALPRSSRARCKMGMISASDGASMTCSKAVSSNCCMHFSACKCGLSRAFKTDGTMAWISGFLMTLPILAIAPLPEICTLGCASDRVFCNRGTICGKHAESCFGAMKAIAPRSSTLPSFVRHLSLSMPSSSCGNTNFTP
mmetsp:Transcript_11479/g.29359  ORF Transcript_11479/g.29359 Transcript_11479/m.29359 type:complete len:205 (+) Transcript_11479:2991-3605(+)